MDKPTEDTQCFFCGKTFTGKNELMKHRKREHVNIVKECDKYREGKCGFENEFCWFLHNMKTAKNDRKDEKNVIDNEMDIDSESEQSKATESVFHKAQKKAKPPSGDKN